LSLSDGSTDDNVQIIGGSNVTVTRNSNSQLTISANVTSVQTAQNVQVDLDNTANAIRYLTFVDSTGTSERLRVDNGLAYNPSVNTIIGNLSGTASNANTLQGIGAGSFVQQNTPFIEMVRSGGPFIDFKDNASEDFDARIINNPSDTIRIEGRLGVSNMPTTTTTVNVWYNITDDRFYRFTSSRKVKENISTITESIANNFLENANPVEFDSIIDEGSPHRYGFVAEEMHEVDPILTEYDENDEPISVVYTVLPAVLTKIVQMQNDRINKLESQVQQLLDQLSAE
jgi:hypothetical protein